VNAALLARAARLAKSQATPTMMGRVMKVTGLLLEASVPGARVGDKVAVEREGDPLWGEVLGFRDDLALIVPFADVRGIAPGARVRMRGAAAELPVGAGLRGRMVDPVMRPLDGGPDIVADAHVPVDGEAPPPSERARIKDRFETGVRVIDGLLTCGRGQRIGIFAGAGVGKTVLIRQIAAQCAADITVIGLIGERGCEVKDLLDMRAMDDSVLVVATSDRSPMERVRGAHAATAVAEYFRDHGANVLLIVDSLTRYAMARREIGLAAGEPPATKGYPPSVFAALPRLVERVAPMSRGGSITAFYTVLVEGDDMSDPVSDSARSLLDAHIILSRDLAGRGHFPAIDVLPSASRVARQVTTPAEQVLQQRARALLAKRREVDELRSLGAYVPGTNVENDTALALGNRIDGWMRQQSEERSEHGKTMQTLAALLDEPVATKGPVKK
jgi:flagellum-specific ATP synthase